MSTDRKEMPSSSLSAPPLGGEGSGLQPLDEDLDMGLDADDEGDGEKDPAEGNDSLIDAAKVELLKGIINPGATEQVSTLPKLGDKRGPGQLNSSISSDSSTEDLDAKDTWPKRKGSMPVKVTSNTGQWTEEDINVVHQLHYKTDLEHFQKYRHNKITGADLSTINTNDHSAYIKVAKVDPGTVVEKSVFSVAAYQQVLWLKGGDTSKFDREVSGLTCDEKCDLLNYRIFNLTKAFRPIARNAINHLIVYSEYIFRDPYKSEEEEMINCEDINIRA